MKFSQMTVGTRLGLGFGVLVAAVALVGGTGLMRMSEMRGNIERIVHKDWNKARLAMEIEARARDNATKTGELFLAEGDAIARIQAKVEENKAVITRNLDELEKLLYLAEGKALHAKIKEARVAYVQSFTKVQKLQLEPQSRAEAVRLYQAETMPALELFMGNVVKLVDLQKRVVSDTAEQSEKDYGASRSLMIMIVVTALAAGVLLASLIVRGLLKQLGGEPAYAMEVAGRVASGDLATEVALKAGDTSSVLYGLREMRDNLGATVGRIRAGSVKVHQASEEISQGNTDLSTRTEEQASALEETSASMQQMTATVSMNAENAKKAKELALQATGVAARGGDAVREVVGTMNGITESSKRISDIIGVIDGIAFQTNILALNAAVEAARAGEQGRGFAVVASEVRNLAQRSASAAKEIKGLITDSVSKVEAGSRQVDEAGKTVEQVVVSVKQVSDLIADIAAASQEQSQGIEQVSETMMQMEKVTQQNAAMVEQATAAAASLQDQAGMLAQAVEAFKLDATVARAVPDRARARSAALAPAADAAPVPLPRSGSRRPALSAKASAGGQAAGKGKNGEWEQF